MVVRMDAVFAQPAAQQLGGPVGDHLVGIHIMAGAGAGLEGLHHKLIVPLAFHHFPGSLLDGPGPFGVQQAQILG